MNYEEGEDRCNYGNYVSHDEIHGANLGENRVPSKRWSKVRASYIHITTFQTNLWLRPSRRVGTISRVILIIPVLIPSSRWVSRISSVVGRVIFFETIPRERRSRAVIAFILSCIAINPACGLNISLGNEGLVIPM